MWLRLPWKTGQFRIIFTLDLLIAAMVEKTIFRIIALAIKGWWFLSLLVLMLFPRLVVDRKHGKSITEFSSSCIEAWSVNLKPSHHKVLESETCFTRNLLRQNLTSSVTCFIRNWLHHYYSFFWMYRDDDFDSVLEKNPFHDDLFVQDEWWATTCDS